MKRRLVSVGFWHSRAIPAMRKVPQPIREVSGHEPIEFAFLSLRTTRLPCQVETRSLSAAYERPGRQVENSGGKGDGAGQDGPRRPIVASEQSLQWEPLILCAGNGLVPIPRAIPARITRPIRVTGSATKHRGYETPHFRSRSARRRDCLLSASQVVGAEPTVRTYICPSAPPLKQIPRSSAGLCRGRGRGRGADFGWERERLMSCRL